MREHVMTRAWRWAQVAAEKRGGSLTFALEGEDRILNRLFLGSPGFFVDVGAHHPVRFSNTFLLYLRYWRGINIDAAPRSMEAFRRMRNRDINVEVGIGKSAAVEDLSVFDEPALNTFDADVAAGYEAVGHRVVNRVEVRIRPLADVLVDHVPAGVSVDLLCVDVEGRDLDVLESNDWERFRPRVVCCEQHEADGADPPIATFLRSLGYEPVARTPTSVICRMPA